MYKLTILVILIVQVFNILDLDIFGGATVLSVIYIVLSVFLGKGVSKYSIFVSIILLSLLVSKIIPTVINIHGLLYLICPVLIVGLRVMPWESIIRILTVVWYWNCLLYPFGLSGFNHWSYLPVYGTILYGLFLYRSWANQKPIKDKFTILSIWLVVLSSLSLKGIFGLLLMSFLSVKSYKIFIRRALAIGIIVSSALLTYPSLVDKLATYSVRYGIEFWTSPRGKLYWGGYEIARDNFPFGSGPSSYGSPGAIVNKSGVYNDYNLIGYGLDFDTIGEHNFFFDAFWSGILGEIGFIGLVFYLGLIASRYFYTKRSFLFFMIILFQSLWTHFFNDMTFILLLLVLIPGLLNKWSNKIYQWKYKYVTK